MFLSIFGLAGGIGMPMQTSINAQLGKRVGSPFTAAMINFMVGLAALLIVTFLVEHSLRLPFGSIAAAPPWVLLGGVFAVVFVTGNILLMPRIGSVQTAILPAMGQIIMGSLIDTFGWFNSAQKDMTAARIIGVILVFCGVLIVIIAKSGGIRKIGITQADQIRHVWLWRLFGVIVGMCMASQTAVNSHLGIVVESRFYAAVVNFTIGLSLLIILHFLLLKTKKKGVKEGRTPIWILTGGLFGVLFVVGNIITAQTVGTGMAVVILLTGLMIGGLIVDQFGLFRSKQRQVGLREIAGVAVMVVGAVLFHIV
ncbi:MAG: DMT family transporter [Firmicutes bacterium]|nr:DMT family transporter [Bacillota bacterium]